EAPIAGYGVVDLSWQLETSDGSGPVVVNGTIQDVQAFIDSEKPVLTQPFTSDEAPTSSLAKRTVFSRADTKCGNFPFTGPQLVREQITYLRKVNGQPRNGPGPGNCGRVSCTDKAGIWWCNDVNTAKQLASFGSIADGAQTVLDACSRDSTTGYAGYDVSGQAFYPTNCNVIVRKDKC
ncbi:hypothetical protein EJ07DRAFT_128597, partial [Lizonia empirigonia]